MLKELLLVILLAAVVIAVISDFKSPGEPLTITSERQMEILMVEKNSIVTGATIKGVIYRFRNQVKLNKDHIYLLIQDPEGDAADIYEHMERAETINQNP